MAAGANRRNTRSLDRQKGRKKLRSLLLASFLAVSVCLGTYYIVRHSIRTGEIVFTGNNHLKNEELTALIKIRKGDKTFGVSGAEIQKSLLRSPWIKDAVIRRELSGRMLVKVTEAAPVAILSLSGRPYLVDRDGAVLEEMKEGTVLFLPVIKDIDPRVNAETYNEAIKFVRVLHDKRILSPGGSLEISGQRPEEIALKLDSVSIKVGIGDFERKLGRLKFVRDEIEKRNMSVEYIDLRFSNRIIVKPVGGAASGMEKVVNGK